jgi:signal transduction histidine kinase
MLNQQLAQVGRLLTGIVHEIRGPLSVVRGHAELLDLLTKGDQEVHQWVAPILRNAKLMQLRLTHLMAAVRAGSGRPEPTDLDALVKEAVDLFTRAVDPRETPVPIDIRTDLPDGFRLSVDAGKLLLVLINLFTNADQAMRKDGRPPGGIHVRLYLQVGAESSEVWIGVADDGPGIPPAIVNRIFEPFFTTKESGSGYGLFLSADILTAMGGKLVAENRPEGGARFSLVIPIPQAPSVKTV